MCNGDEVDQETYPELWNILNVFAGKTWTNERKATYYGDAVNYGYGIAKIGDYFVLGTNIYSTSVTDSAGIYYSTSPTTSFTLNGLNYGQSNIDRCPIRFIDNVNNMVVCGGSLQYTYQSGNAYIWYSTNGTSYTGVNIWTSGDTSNYQYNKIHGIGFDGTYYFVTGEEIVNNTTPAATFAYATSINSSSWTRVNSTIIPGLRAGFTYITNPVYGNGYYCYLWAHNQQNYHDNVCYGTNIGEFAVLNNHIYSSNFNEYFICNKLRFVNGYFVAMGYIFTSSPQNKTGVLFYTDIPTNDWTQVNIPEITDITDIIYDNGLYIITGASSNVTNVNLNAIIAYSTSLSENWNVITLTNNTSSNSQFDCYGIVPSDDYYIAIVINRYYYSSSYTTYADISYIPTTKNTPSLSLSNDTYTYIKAE